MCFLSDEVEKQLALRVLDNLDDTKNKEFGVFTNRPYVNTYKTASVPLRYVIEPRSKVKSVNTDCEKDSTGYISTKVCDFFDGELPIRVNLEDFDGARAERVSKELMSKYKYSLDKEIIHRLNYDIEECVKLCRLSYYDIEKESKDPGSILCRRRKSDKIMDNA